MMEELKLKYHDLNDVDDEGNMIKKIIELNFNEDEIKRYYDINRLYTELDDEYGISGFAEEEKAWEKW